LSHISMGMAVHWRICGACYTGSLCMQQTVETAVVMVVVVVVIAVVVDFVSSETVMMAVPVLPQASGFRPRRAGARVGGGRGGPTRPGPVLLCVVCSM
jgi:hypothetical protein